MKHLDEPVTGAGPSSLMLSGDTLFGTTTSGGAEFGGGGTIFKLNTDGGGFSVVKSFVGFEITTPSSPSGGLLLVGNTLYGTTQYGGTGYYGTIFKVNADGSGYSVIRNLGGVDGNYPRIAMIESGGKPVRRDLGGRKFRWRHGFQNRNQRERLHRAQALQQQRW